MCLRGLRVTLPLANSLDSHPLTHRQSHTYAQSRKGQLNTHTLHASIRLFPSSRSYSSMAQAYPNIRKQAPASDEFVRDLNVRLMCPDCKENSTLIEDFCELVAAPP